MPELPEVESLRLGLVNAVVGQTFVSVKVHMPKIVSGKGTKREISPQKVVSFEHDLVGQTIQSIHRRAKNLIFNLSGGGLILVHLKMTGQLVYKPMDGDLVYGGHPIEDSQNNLPNKHTYIIFEFNNGNLYYNDVRQFGYVLYYPKNTFQDDEHFKELGVEPMSPDFTLENFSQELKKKTGVLKKVFLDQTVVVGLGNIYADEVSFEAKVIPTRKVSTLKKSEIIALYYAIKKIIPKAVELGGSSIANYLLADGSRGNYAHHHKVYNRGGKPCLDCGNLLISTVSSGRTTVYCKYCQK